MMMLILSKQKLQLDRSESRTYILWNGYAQLCCMRSHGNGIDYCHGPSCPCPSFLFRKVVYAARSIPTLAQLATTTRSQSPKPSSCCRFQDPKASSCCQSQDPRLLPVDDLKTPRLLPAADLNTSSLLTTVDLSNFSLSLSPSLSSVIYLFLFFA